MSNKLPYKIINIRSNNFLHSCREGRSEYIKQFVILDINVLVHFCTMWFQVFNLKIKSRSNIIICTPMKTFQSPHNKAQDLHIPEVSFISLAWILKNLLVGWPSHSFEHRKPRIEAKIDAFYVFTCLQISHSNTILNYFIKNLYDICYNMLLFNF